MGKIIRHNKTKFIATAVLFLLFLVSAAYAADTQREFDLFDRGYKYYLSYQPEKAAGEFRQFLKEFPRSSATDAVMFWLGKSLAQLKSFGEAKRVFADIKRQFPESPFVRYADKELDAMRGVSVFAGNVPDNAVSSKTSNSGAGETAGKGGRAPVQEKHAQRTHEQKEELKSTPLEKKITEKAEAPVEHPVAPESGKRIPPAISAASTGGGEALKAPGLPEKSVSYSIQIGAFSKQSTTERLKAEFEKEGYPVKIIKGTLNGGEVFKVLVGQFSDKDEAGYIARGFESKYGENTIVSISEAKNEVRLPGTGLTETEEPGEARPVSLPAVQEKEMIKMASTPVQPLHKDAGLKNVQSGIKEQQKRGEDNQQRVASKEEKAHAGVSPGPFKEEEKQAEVGPVEENKGGTTATLAQADKKEALSKDGGRTFPEEAKEQEGAGHDEGLKASGEPPRTPAQLPDKKRKTEAAQKVRGGDIAGSNTPEVEIKDFKYTTRELPEYMAASRSLFKKLQIKEVLWRTGDETEDFLNEQVLYDEARSLHMTADRNRLTEMVENYQLDDREADYLRRYLVISDFIQDKIKGMPREKVVESLVVRYGEGDRYMKIVLGTELQNLAKKGTSFEEIYRLYPDVVTFSVTGFSELGEPMKEKVQSLPDNAIVVTWSEDGYMLLKLLFRGPEFKPFGDISPGLRDRMRAYILAAVKGLREKYSAKPVKEKDKDQKKI